jgi:NAD(P)-dependent dehydrogenase (short-subunit alcohol dehydrogenase family)
VVNNAGRIVRIRRLALRRRRRLASRLRRNVHDHGVTDRALLPHLCRPGGLVIAISSVAALPQRRLVRRGEGRAATWMYGLSPSSPWTDNSQYGSAWLSRTPGSGTGASPRTYDARVGAIPMGQWAPRRWQPRSLSDRPDSGYTAGQILQVNGGWVTGR